MLLAENEKRAVHFNSHRHSYLKTSTNHYCLVHFSNSTPTTNHRMKGSASVPNVGRKNTSSSRGSKTAGPKSRGRAGKSKDSSSEEKKGVNWKWKPPKSNRKARPYRGSATGKYMEGVGGGRFSMSNPKSYIDWEVYRAKQTPGPNRYTLPDPSPAGGCAKISDANPKSELDWIILRASKTPGPSEYDPVLVEASKGVQFSDANPKSYLDWAVHNSKKVPGPGTYQIDLCPYPNIAKKKH